MCGRYTLKTPFRVIYEALNSLIPTFDFAKPRFNIAPSQSAPVVRLNATGDRVMDLVRWGLIPSWTKGKPKMQPINARAETVATSGMFRQAMERRRCLVPADGFYEWKVHGKAKQPMYIRVGGGDVFAFAGLWERWAPADSDEPIDTYTIITTTPNAVMKEIHDRMPVILQPADYERWLDRATPGDGVADLLRPRNPEDMDAYPVSTLVNSPRNDVEACTQPLPPDDTQPTLL